MPTATILLSLLGLFIVEVWGHGRLMEPPGRSTAWRFGFDTPINYNDDELYCGGLTNQIKQGYKCGICGDPWQGPRHHEAGGKYAFGTIVRHFKQPGSVIDVFVQMTMNHMGWFEFRLCPHNDINTPATHECLDRYLLERADGKGTRYNIQSKAERNVTLQLRLPQGLTCSQCVLQWKWHCGNNWGIDPDTGRGCYGCGYQEEFYGCADIAIGINLPSLATIKPTEPTKPTTPSYRCRAIGPDANLPGMDRWCENLCSAGSCPADRCKCD